MSLCKWSCICFLGGLILIGWPATVNCDSPGEEKQPPKVKDCRVHIEKALEQYWDKKEPEEILTPSDGPSTNYLNENESTEEEETNIRETRNSKEDLETPEHREEAEPEESDNEEENVDDGDENEDDEQQDSQITETLADGEDEDDDDDDEADENDDEAEENNDEADEDEDEEDEETEDLKVSDEQPDEEDETNETLSETPEEEDSEDADDGEEDMDEDEDDENYGNETNTQEESIEKEESNIDLEDENEEDDDEADDNEDDDEDNGGEEHNEETDREELSDESDKRESTTSEISPDESEKEGEKSVGETPEEGNPAEQSKTKEADVPITEKEIPQPTPTIDSVITENKEVPSEEEPAEEAHSESELEEKEDDTIENIYEEEEEFESPSGSTFRSREHIDVILGLDEVGTEVEKEEEKLAQSVFRDIKKIETTQIKPVELLYKYADSTTRVLGDAEIFNKPILLFLGPWSTGKTAIINYILGLERTPSALKTGTGITDVDFSVLTYGPQRRVISGTELAADWKYAGVQKFGQGFLDHFRSIHIPHPLLQKVTIIDSPGIVENRKNNERGYSLNAAFQWFIDRADAVYVVLDPVKVDIGGELGSVIEQMQGREVRFLLNKADTIRRSDLMRVVGQLFWNLSPLMGGAEAPLIYAVSLTTNPYHPSAPAKFLADQEKNFLYDMKSTLDKRVENKILYARKHAVRVRNHAKMVDCYLASYYRHKSIFSSKRNVAKQITENPREYSIYDGLTSMSNVSRSDVPNPLAYKEFFKLHPLYDFKPLASTCSYFRGCPMDKVDIAITKDFPELLAKYKGAKRALYGHLEEDR